MREFDIEAHVRATPHGATCKGVLFAGAIERARRARPDVDVAAVAGVERRRYLAFLNYPYDELLRVLPAAAVLVFPGVPPAEALRRLGRGAFGDFRATRAGSIFLGLLADELAAVLVGAPGAYSMTLSLGRFATERLGARHVRMRFDDYPGYLETYDVGVLEGVIASYREEGVVRAERSGPLAGAIDVRW